MIESRSPMVLKIEHEARLSYSAPVTETVFVVRLAPPSDEDQTALSYRLRIEPAAPVTSYRDGRAGPGGASSPPTRTSPAPA